MGLIRLARIFLARVCLEISYRFLRAREKLRSAPPFHNLPPELRLEIYRCILRADPPYVTQNGEIHHFLLSLTTPFPQHEVLQVLFHTTPLLITPGLMTMWHHNITIKDHEVIYPSSALFLLIHDHAHGPNQRHRVRIAVHMDSDCPGCVVGQQDPMCPDCKYFELFVRPRFESWRQTEGLSEGSIHFQRSSMTTHRQRVYLHLGEAGYHCADAFVEFVQWLRIVIHRTKSRTFRLFQDARNWFVARLSIIYRSLLAIWYLLLIPPAFRRRVEAEDSLHTAVVN